MKPVLIAVALAVLAGCNPVPRCKASADCLEGGVCSGGFCTDLPVGTPEPDAGPPPATTMDQDDPDGGTVDGGTTESADAGLNNGRP